ncbi:large ribosomal subunit protein bL21m isoform 2-T2 [Morphnus guianensis]
MYWRLNVETESGWKRFCWLVLTTSRLLEGHFSGKMSHRRIIFKTILNCSFRAPTVSETEEKPGFISTSFFPSPVAFERITNKTSSSASAGSNHCHTARIEQQYPFLRKDLVRVEATVIEKTESWPKINMRFRKRHNYQRKKIIVNPQTVLRINTIEIFPCLS